MANLKKNVKDHYAKKNPGSAEFFRKQRKERNAARGPQDIVETIRPDGTVKIDRIRQ